ncbi:MAG: hypothetical protein QM488_19605 [Rhizobiaceae bacterium]
MTNKDLWEQYGNFTIDLSNNARKLAFAAAGLSWLFKTIENTFPAPVLCALLAIIIFFICDILQYFLGAIRLKKWIESEEETREKETGSIEGEYKKPKNIDTPSFYCWVAKVIALLASYAFLGLQIFL